MAFVKLDRDILRSTIWFDRPAREVFITALLLAEPHEFESVTPQIAVGALEPTGWGAPPGWYGFVAASGPGIVDASKVPFEEGMAALRRLGDPEPESRSQKFEGRRMIRVDGGYLILNFMKHRDKDHTSKFRSARYRERLKTTASHRDATEKDRDVTYARMPLPNHSGSDSGSDRKGSAEGKPATLPQDTLSSLSPSPDPSEPAKLKQSPRERVESTGAQPVLKYEFDPKWKPKESHRARGLELGLTDDEVLAKADDCKLKTYTTGFRTEDRQFMRELTWAKNDKETKNARATRGDDYERPGHDRRPAFRG